MAVAAAGGSQVHTPAARISLRQVAVCSGPLAMPAPSTDLQRFLHESLPGFSYNRAKTDRDSTSRLSPHIHVGELSVRQVRQAVRSAC